MGRKLVIIALICVVLVLAGCSGGGSQVRGQDCSVSKINELGEYYEQQRQIKYKIMAGDGLEYPPTEAYKQMNELLTMVSNYDPPACASVVHSYFLISISKLVECYQYSIDAYALFTAGNIDKSTETLNKATEAMRASDDEYQSFFDKFQKLGTATP